jgi:hypothetical protein
MDRPVSHHRLCLTKWDLYRWCPLTQKSGRNHDSENGKSFGCTMTPVVLGRVVTGALPSFLV